MRTIEGTLDAQRGFVLQIYDGGGELGTVSDRLTESTACRHGTLSYPANDVPVGLSLRLYGEWAEAEVQLLSRFLRSGDVYLDVGAHVGATAVAAMDVVGPEGLVIVCETAPSLLALAEENLRRAAGSRYLSLASFDNTSIDTCSVVRVDVSVDVQASSGILQKVISEARPVIVIGLTDVDGLVTALQGLEWPAYRSFIGRTPLYNPLNFKGERENVFGWACGSSLLMVPDERVGELGTTMSPSTVHSFKTLDAGARLLLATPRAGDASDRDRDPERLRADLALVQDSLKKAEFRVRALERRVMTLLESAKDQEAALQEVRQLVTHMATSRSWRVTAPLRSVRKQR